ncbi:DUF4142 domain-containing protein [Mucilaginibacter sp.]|uniref:DUF4142 domain-containing protein n=1 Tax=Mucilaginibacter sp. TaxID=1882438 RepID=UPI002620AFB6|nr:DUF4142 domain-containing protein [Mucilaginibacter sp.]MDB4925903.1 hypothetical protein [Mucilaginibacter sp.]
MRKTSSIIMIMLSALMFQACKDSKKENSIIGIDQTGSLVSEDDANFAASAADRGTTEVELSFFAKDKLVNSKVKELAAKILKDYAKANEELMNIATAKKINLPLNSDGQEEKDELNSKSGSEFDKAFIAKLAEGNEKAVKLFDDGTDDVKDKELNAFAVKTLAILKKQADDIKAIQDSMK